MHMLVVTQPLPGEDCCHSCYNSSTGMLLYSKFGCGPLWDESQPIGLYMSVSAQSDALWAFTFHETAIMFNGLVFMLLYKARLDLLWQHWLKCCQILHIHLDLYLVNKGCDCYVSLSSLLWHYLACHSVSANLLSLLLCLWLWDLMESHQSHTSRTSSHWSSPTQRCSPGFTTVPDHRICFSQSLCIYKLWFYPLPVFFTSFCSV